MHQDEPSLLQHFSELRSAALPEGGLTTVIFCGKLRNDGDLAEVLGVHTTIVENEVNEEEVSVTGLLVGQVPMLIELIEA